MVKTVPVNGLEDSTEDEAEAQQPKKAKKANAVEKTTDKEASEVSDNSEIIPPTQPVASSSKGKRDVECEGSNHRETKALRKSGTEKKAEKPIAERSKDQLVELAPSRIVKRGNITAEDIRCLLVKCTSCGNQVNHHDKKQVKKHPHLGVIICKDCRSFYADGNFSEDEEGDKYCRWCAQGGTVFGCDYCRNVFCSECIRRNFGRGEVRRVQDSEWKCYSCDPSKLKEKVAYCDMVIDFSYTINEKARRKTELGGFRSTRSTRNRNGQDWVSAVLSGVVSLSDKLKRRIDLLKSKHASGEKSLKYIVKKLEIILDEHRNEVKYLMKSVTNTYKNHSRNLAAAFKNDPSQLQPASPNGVSQEPVIVNGNAETKADLPVEAAVSSDAPVDRTSETESQKTAMGRLSDQSSSGIKKILLRYDRVSRTYSKKDRYMVPPVEGSGDLPGAKITENLFPSDAESSGKRKEDENKVIDIIDIVSGPPVKSITALSTQKTAESDGGSGEMEMAETVPLLTASDEKIQNLRECASVNVLVGVDSGIKAAKKSTDTSTASDAKRVPIEKLFSSDSDSSDENKENEDIIIDISSESPAKDIAALPRQNTAELDGDSDEVKIDETISPLIARDQKPPKVNKCASISKWVSVDLNAKAAKESADSGSASDATTVALDSMDDEDDDFQSSKRTKKCKLTPQRRNNAKQSPRSKRTTKTPSQRKKSSLSLSSDIDIIEASSVDSSDVECKKKVHRKRNQRRDAEDICLIASLVERGLISDDEKLRAPCKVSVQRLAISPSCSGQTEESSKDVAKNISKTGRKHSTDDDVSELDHLEKEAKKLLREAARKNKAASSVKNAKNTKSHVKKKVSGKKNDQQDSGSELISLSSSEDEKFEIAAYLKTISPDKALNINSKQKLLHDRDVLVSSSEDLSSDDSPEKPKRKKTGKKMVETEAAASKKMASSTTEKDSSESSEDESKTEVIDDDDSEEIVKPRKKRKKERLLKTRLNLSDDDFQSTDRKERNEERKKKSSVKRKILSSGDEELKNGHSTCTTDSSDSSTKRRRRRLSKKGRKRIKVADSSDDEDKGKKEKEEDSTPGKGRKNIRKVISHRNLAEETRAAQEAEKERRKRVAEKQKLYNQIVEDAAEGDVKITKKFVLEVDPDSKEEVVEIPPEIVEKLKPHQVNGVKFMWECTIESLKNLKTEPGSGCILAHCMGLGKTLQVIAFLYTLFSNKRINKTIRTAMIICPYNTVLNWMNEFDVWLEDCDHKINLYELSVVKTNRARLDYLQEWSDCGGVLVLGYNMFSRLAEGKLNRAGSKLKESVKSLICDGPDMVICDEGHMLKNENSALSKAASKLRTRRRIVLTGTPLQNNLKEYHCMMHFVKPHLLGTSKEFLNRFVNPIINGQYDNSSKHDVQLMKKRVHILHKLLEGCVQRCDYSALTKFLPPKLEFVISVKLSEVQIKLYRYYLENKARGSGNSADGGKLFQDYSKLKNIWTYPYILFKDFERAEKRKIFDDDDEFLDDNSYDSNDSFINDGSEDDPDKELEEDDPKPGTSRDTNDSSEEEIIRSHKTRRHDGDPSDDDTVQETSHWWEEFFSKDDQFKIELSGKMVLVMDILKQCDIIGDKVLLFSQSLLALDAVEMILHHEDEEQQKRAEAGEDKNEDVSLEGTYGSWSPGIDYFRMDGSTNVDFRKRWIDLFNDPNNPRARLFLISTKAGSLGTNLVGANRVIMLDASWNPSHDVQAIFRVYRFGQVKPVYIYRLLAQGTMEEKIYNRQVTKLSLSCRVVDEQQIDRHFSPAQLSELYSFDPDSRTERPTPMVPKDRLLADLLRTRSDWIVTYHEHDSLLQSSNEVDLTEEERQAAWTEYENEKEGIYQRANVQQSVDNSQKNFVPDIDEAVRMLIQNLRRLYPNLLPYECNKKIIGQLENLRKNYMQRHVHLLRQKQEYVSKSLAIPPAINFHLDTLEKALYRITMYVDHFKRENDQIAKGNSGAQPMTNIRFAGTQNMWARFTGTQPMMRTQFPQGAGNASNNVFISYGRQRFNFSFVPRPSSVPPVPDPSAKPSPPQPTQTTTIVDVTDDSRVTSSGSTPIITEVEEVPGSLETEKEEAAPSSSAAAASSSVKITEMV